MRYEAGKSVVRFRVRFRDLRTKTDMEENDGRRMVGEGTSIMKMCSEVFIVERRVTGLAVELIVYSESNISQQYLCVTSPTRTKKLLETRLVVPVHMAVFFVPYLQSHCHGGRFLNQ